MHSPKLVAIEKNTSSQWYFILLYSNICIYHVCLTVINTLIKCSDIISQQHPTESLYFKSLISSKRTIPRFGPKTFPRVFPPPHIVSSFPKEDLLLPYYTTGCRSIYISSFQRWPFYGSPRIDIRPEQFDWLPNKNERERERKKNRSRPPPLPLLNRHGSAKNKTVAISKRKSVS